MLGMYPTIPSFLTKENSFNLFNKETLSFYLLLIDNQFQNDNDSDYLK